VDLILGIGYVGFYFFMFSLLRSVLKGVLGSGVMLPDSNIAVPVALIIGILVISIGGSGALLGNSIFWVLLFSMVLVISNVGQYKERS